MFFCWRRGPYMDALRGVSRYVGAPFQVLVFRNLWLFIKASPARRIHPVPGVHFRWNVPGFFIPTSLHRHHARKITHALVVFSSPKREAESTRTTSKITPSPPGFRRNVHIPPYVCVTAPARLWVGEICHIRRMLTLRQARTHVHTSFRHSCVRGTSAVETML